MPVETEARRLPRHDDGPRRAARGWATPFHLTLTFENAGDDQHRRAGARRGAVIVAVAASPRIVRSTGPARGRRDGRRRAAATAAPTSGPSAVAFSAADGTAVVAGTMAGHTGGGQHVGHVVHAVREGDAGVRRGRLQSTDGVRIIGVNVGDSADDAATFAADLGVTLRAVHRPRRQALHRARRCRGLPATAFVDADGKVVEVHQGALHRRELRDAIAPVLPRPRRRNHTVSRLTRSTGRRRAWPRCSSPPAATTRRPRCSAATSSTRRRQSAPCRCPTPAPATPTSRSRPPTASSSSSTSATRSAPTCAPPRSTR